MTQITDLGRGRAGVILECGNAELVLSIRSWARLASIGYSSAKKLLASGKGPAVVQLSAHRIGVTTGAHQRWLADRERPQRQRRSAT